MMIGIQSEFILFSENHLAKPVNVSTVPKRSPFRYPGGKTWLVPYIRNWLASLPEKPMELCEPFAGGGIVSLTVAFERLANRVSMVELDSQVAAVWQTILEEDGAEWLAKRILNFRVTSESVREALGETPTSTRERAFQTILKNRTYHGGILAPGSAPVKMGENGKGITSRWYPTTLAARIRAIGKIRERISFTEGDGLTAIETNTGRKDIVWFIDPPYTASKKKAGSRLYTHFNLDHGRLFDLVQGLSGDFLMTYDNADEIKDLAKAHSFDTELVAMKNTHNSTMVELLVGRDLTWARRSRELGVRS
jgi:DNA adenine methylase